MPWGRAPTVINVGSGTPQDMGSLTAALQELRDAVDRQTLAIAANDRRLDLIDATLSGIQGRLAALYPVLDRLYRRAGLGRGRRRAGEEEDAPAA